MEEVLICDPNYLKVRWTFALRLYVFLFSLTCVFFSSGVTIPSRPVHVSHVAREKRNDETTEEERCGTQSPSPGGWGDVCQTGQWGWDFLEFQSQYFFCSIGKTVLVLFPGSAFSYQIELLFGCNTCKECVGSLCANSIFSIQFFHSKLLLNKINICIYKKKKKKKKVPGA